MHNPTTTGTASPVPTPRDLEKAIAHADLPHNEKLQLIRNKQAFIIDMDGVIYHGSKLLDGTVKFIEWLKANNKKFLFLTNNSAPTPRELQQKLHRLGIDVDESHFYTSAICTAKFLCSQRPRGTVFCLGAPGLHYACFTMSEVAADYVVVGEGGNMSYENIAKAVKLVNKGPSDWHQSGRERARRRRARARLWRICLDHRTGYWQEGLFLGKPNPIMLRGALRLLGVHRENAVMVGDRMDTDVLVVLNGVGDIPGPVDGAEGEESRRLTDLP
ncbi:HAD-like domain-containing protein [Catenaria anguillulae PL171]|uniref:HAD-like domain-containing protein n=1 Tax=Catenaria anguillulae PL171 TaxID=765915 RepID=A0A1Y2HAC2_9FUNG|nr:HAD-like domain-containing protein [Catenaria anguillulae PL171]